jgi:hypothetical protein
MTDPEQLRMWYEQHLKRPPRVLFFGSHKPTEACGGQLMRQMIAPRLTQRR